jgi:hypothetical protein
MIVQRRLGRFFWLRAKTLAILVLLTGKTHIRQHITSPRLNFLNNSIAIVLKLCGSTADSLADAPSKWVVSEAGRSGG